MVEVKLTGKPMEQRIADRLKNSGDTANADVVAQLLATISRRPPTIC
jgi:hypothetical protein